MKYTHISWSLLAAGLLILASCGKDEPSIVPDTVKPYSNLLSDNKNIKGGGVISTQYSDSPSGSDIGKLADNDESTAFVTGHSEFYILINCNKAFSLKSYAIVSSTADAASDPSAWTLYGSNDNKTWNSIDKKSGQVFSGRNVKNEYKVSTTPTYKYYRLNITANNGGATTAIAELIYIDGTATTIDDLMSKAQGFTHSERTPMGKYYENRHRTTDSDLEWLLNPDNEPTATIEAEGYTWQTCEVILYPYGTPLPADVNQRAIGDCCFCASLASMAYIYPDFVKSIIKDNGDNTYTVSMYDPQGNKIKVCLSDKFLVNGDGYIGQMTSKNDSYVCWTAVLEKALLKWNSIYHCNDCIDGIGTEHAIPPFVGNGDSYAFDYNVLTYDEMERAVTVLLNDGWFVIGGFHLDDVVIGDGPFKTVTAHAFTFMFVNSGNATYGMRNPWGHANGTEHSHPADGVAPIPRDGRTQQLIDIRVCNPGAAAEYKQKYLMPYTPPTL